MRLYTFTHFMLSSMAQGIQPLHATVELFNKYTPTTYNDFYMQDERALFMLREWAYNHKTAICLNGGITPNLDDTFNFFNDQNNTYPWAEFCEDESLGNLMTSIAIVLPAKIYKMAEYIRKGWVVYNPNTWHYEILDNPRSPIELTVEEAESFGTLVTHFEYTPYEVDLIALLNRSSLAR